MTADLGPQLEQLYRIEKFIASLDDFDRLLETIIHESAAALDAESASLALYDEASDDLYFFVVDGDGPREDSVATRLKQVRLPMGQGVLGWCAERREPALINDAYADPRFSHRADDETGFVTRSILAVPMTRGERLVGVVEAVNKRQAEGFEQGDLHLLTILAAQAALVIENARLYQENLHQARLSAMGQGIAGAAHCIKNILHGLSGGEFIVESGLKRRDMGKVDQGWGLLKRNTTVMRELVLDMLSYAKPREPEYEPADPDALCRQVAELVQGKADEKGVSLVLDLQAGPAPVRLDPQGVYRCLLNLVANAVDACDGSDGRITVSSRRNARRIEIRVADNGCGMDEAALAQLFKPFFSTKGTKGTGLGLAVSEKIVAEHGGRIRVDSRAGEGTAFTVELPLTAGARDRRQD